MTCTHEPSATEVFIRVVGQRQHSPPGQLPPPKARAAMSANARYHTRVPKGVFIYRSHEEANADRRRWLLDAMAARRNA